MSHYETITSHTGERAYIVTDSRYDLPVILDAYDIAAHTQLTVSDVDWFEEWAPEMLGTILTLASSLHVYGMNLAVYEDRAAYELECELYGDDPDDEDGILTFEDAELSGYVVFTEW